MFQISIYSRQKDGNRGTLITVSKYKTEAEAQKAKFVLKQLKLYKGLLPHDAEAVKLHKPNVNKWTLGNIIVTDPERIK